jgi:vacuolar-type H+-ATPase subunit I/STV1
MRDLHGYILPALCYLVTIFNYATLALSYPSVSTVFISALKYLFYIYGLIQIIVVDVVGGGFFFSCLFGRDLHGVPCYLGYYAT